MKKLIRYFKIYKPTTLLNYLLLEVNIFLRGLIKSSYSQWGEDLLIDKLLGFKQNGFYVDIGAYDPTRFSNTKRFYKKGWRGINIEPDPFRFQKFLDERPRDVNLNTGVANQNRTLNFFKFSPQTLSTFSEKSKETYQKQGYLLSETLKIPVQKLSFILAKSLKNKNIDFLSIDTEGLDLEVLKSNNWQKYKPKVICIETHDKKSTKLLTSYGYKKIYGNKTNLIYILSA